MKNEIKKVVLAYSGGLDTSIIVRWLQQTYHCEVVTFTADIGQGEELTVAQAKAEKMGVKQTIVEDLKREFAEQYVFPMLCCNTTYEGEYLLGTAIARPLIAKRLVDIAKQVGADAIAHGATGKGNDQVRFELGAYALQPDIKVIAPWREWELNSREKLMQYAKQHNIAVDFDQGKKSPYSMDANLLHISYEGGVLEDTKAWAEESMWRWTNSIEAAPDVPIQLTIGYQAGIPISINGDPLPGDQLMQRLNQLAGEHGVGRADIVENRYVGIKSRGCYETPAGTVLLKAHRAIESITLDREVAHLKDCLMPRYADIIYNGYWWSPERIALQTLIEHTQKNVSGEIQIQLYKGNVSVLSRSSPNSLFSQNIATFEDDDGTFRQQDAEGFIKLHALRLKEFTRKMGRI